MQRHVLPVQLGFTLIEVLISMTILAFISLGIYQATVQTFRLRDSLNNEGDFFNAIRLSMSILERDLALIYTPVSLVPRRPTPGATSAPAALNFNPNGPSFQNPDLARASEFWGAAIDATGLRPSRFQGTETKLLFVSATHQRIYRDSPESEIVKIKYDLRLNDQGEGDLAGTQMLVKSASPNAFVEDERKDKSQIDYPLLRGIKSWKFRYYRREKDQWSSNWDSDKEETKNLYPDLIEVKLEVVGRSQLSFDGIYRFRPEVPLNGLAPTL